jgi:UDP-glucose 4-epimerase
MKLDGRPVLVTGGAGFIGSNLVDALVERGCSVRVVDDLSTGYEENLAEALSGGKVELVEADIRDAAAMREAVRGVDAVLHLAVSNLRVSLSDPWPSHEVNAGGTLTLLEAVKDAGVERFLYCSSSEVYGTAVSVPMEESHPTQPTTVYGASKLAGEWYALAYSRTHRLPVVVARPFNTYGFREHHEGASGEVIPKMAVRALNGRQPVIFGDGSQTRDFTFITDQVRGLIAAAECDQLLGREVNLGRGQEVSILRIAELVCEACGTEVDPVLSDPRPADVDRHLAGVERARELLGFEAEVGIEEGIPAYLAWLRERYPDPSALIEEERERNWEPLAG